MNKPTYEYLYEYYLEDQVNGKMASTNKTYFYKEWEEKKLELERIKRN